MAHAGVGNLYNDQDPPEIERDLIDPNDGEAPVLITQSAIALTCIEWMEPTGSINTYNQIPTVRL